MSAASIIHVGSDDCCRIPVLKTAGYSVTGCASTDQLHLALARIPPADALAITENLGDLPQEAVSLARATTSIPLILFRGADRYLDEANFDLVIPSLTSPKTWLTNIQRLIEECRAMRVQTDIPYKEFSLPIERSVILRKECASAADTPPTESAIEREHD